MSMPRYGISNMVLPEEGPQAIRMVLDFVNFPAGVDVDLSEMIPDYFSAVQGMFVDNYDNAQTLVCTVMNGTQQRLIIPANCQAYLPVICDVPPFFKFVGKAANPGIAIPVYFYNMPIPPLIIK